MRPVRRLGASSYRGAGTARATTKPAPPARGARFRGALKRAHQSRNAHNLRERFIEFFAGLPTQCPQVGALRSACKSANREPFTDRDAEDRVSQHAGEVREGPPDRQDARSGSRLGRHDAGQ
jgi:hypothetical protein